MRHWWVQFVSIHVLDSGYYGMSGVTVEAIPDNFADTTDADAAAGNILAEKTAYVDGEKITGTVSLTAENIKNGVNIFGVTGTYQEEKRPFEVAVYQDMNVAGNVYYLDRNGYLVYGMISGGAPKYPDITKGAVILVLFDDTSVSPGKKLAVHSNTTAPYVKITDYLYIVAVTGMDVAQNLFAVISE